MADIFLSYAREDGASARTLAGALEARGWSIFWDRRIPHGTNFRKHIQNQLASARCIVVLWSKASLASQFVIDEATEGLDDGRLVPALIEAVIQPLGFRGLQAANLADWTGAETSRDEFERLVISIGEIVGAPLIPAGPTSTPGPTGTPPRAWDTVKEWVDDIVFPDVQPQNESEELVGRFPVILVREFWGTLRGLMFLTNQRVRFELSHDHRLWQRLSLGTAALVGSRDRVAAWLSWTRLSIPLSAIESVASSRSGLLSGRGYLITIRCHSGEEYKFRIVKSRLLAAVTPSDLEDLSKQIVAKIEKYRERFQNIS